jgi:hypothetical protein
VLIFSLQSVQWKISMGVLLASLSELHDHVCNGTAPFISHDVTA